MQHDLKTDPEVFKAVWEGKKTFEIRYDDRGYQEGDVLTLQETMFTGEEMKGGAPLTFSGRRVATVVTHVLRGPAYGLAEGWVILSIAGNRNFWEIDEDMGYLRAYTDYPFTFLGDASGQKAPIRKVVVLSYDGDKYCRIVVEGQETEVKAGYLYEKSGRCGEVSAIDLSRLPEIC